MNLSYIHILPQEGKPVCFLFTIFRFRDDTDGKKKKKEELLNIFLSTSYILKTMQMFIKGLFLLLLFQSCLQVLKKDKGFLCQNKLYRFLRALLMFHKIVCPFFLLKVINNILVKFFISINLKFHSPNKC